MRTIPSQRDELLLMSPSFLVPCLTVDELEIWDTLAIGEYLAERFPEAGLLPTDPASRALCRSVSGEMHSGFASLRSAMPMNVKARYEEFKVFSGRPGRHRPHLLGVVPMPGPPARTVPVRRTTDDGGRHVRAGV